MRLVGMKNGTANQENSIVVSRVVEENYHLAQCMLNALETDSHTNIGSHMFLTTL